MTINAKTHRRLFRYPNGVIYEWYGSQSKKSRPNRSVQFKPLYGGMPRQDQVMDIIRPPAELMVPAEVPVVEQVEEVTLQNDHGSSTVVEDLENVDEESCIDSEVSAQVAEQAYSENI